MADSLVVAGLCAELALVCWFAWLYVREQRRADRAEMDRWADLSGTRGTPIALSRPEPLALARTTAPTQAELWLWLLATDGTPSRYQRYPHAEYQPSDDRPRYRQPRATRRYSTGQMHELVGL